MTQDIIGDHKVARVGRLATDYELDRGKVA